LRSNSEGKLFLEIFGDGVLNITTVKLLLRVAYLGTICVLEWQFFPIILPEDHITIEVFFFRNSQCNYLLFKTDVAKKKSRTQNLSADKLTKVDYIWVYIQDVSDLDGVVIDVNLSLGEDWL